MNAMIFAAGLGTRLKPYTDHCPKAMVEVAGRPMIAHQLLRLKEAGFQHVVINVHHYAQQIIDYVTAHNGFGLDIAISDERGKLLDTGGGIRKALPLFDANNPILIHNVDIFSNADLTALYESHVNNGADASLLVSERTTSRYFVFDGDNNLVGWKNLHTGEVRTANEALRSTLERLTGDDKQYRLRAFSGIHVISPSLFPLLEKQEEVFSITNFYWQNSKSQHIRCVEAPEGFQWVDAGKPEMLKRAREIVLIDKVTFE
jgi:NDP-sugar pyrophosphorylase family protein